MFIDRDKELAHLEKLNKLNRARLLILYGRRRIGKTELLRQFSKGKKHLFFSSDLASEQEQLRQITEKIFRITGDSFLQSQPFRSWEALLRYIFDHLSKEISLIIIDEFPYLCVSNKALPSILQKIWDEKAENSKTFIILCGSSMSFMEKEVLSVKSPLYGRRTGQIFLQPLSFKDSTGFFPPYSLQDKVYSYSILGGTPAYLQRFDNNKTIELNVKNEILNKNSFLYSEPRFLLMEELREPSVYFSILKTIAFGKTRLNEIVQETGYSDRFKVNKYLSTLRELKIIRREVPVTEDQPHKSRKGIYHLSDPFFRFWFRYVFPNLSYLEEDEIDYVWEEKIKPDLDSFVGYVFEDICIQKLSRLNIENKLPFKAKVIGRWWNGKNEIDVVLFDGKGSFMFCECKWTTKKVGINLWDELKKKADNFRDVTSKYYAFFSKSGFTPQLRELLKKREDLFLYNYL